MRNGGYRTYLFNASEIKVKPGIDPRQQFIPPYKIRTIHYPYIRHSPFLQSNNSSNKTFIYRKETKQVTYMEWEEERERVRKARNFVFQITLLI